MTIERKVGMGIAGQPSGSTDVADVFSADLYTGTNSTQTIINGIDLDGEGGFVWTKSRSDSGDNNIFYENGSNIDLLKTNSNDTASANMGSYGTAFNSNGFSMGSLFSPNTVDMVAWTFRKKEKFFDIVTYTGNGTSTPQISQTVAHNLGSVPAMMIVKNTTTGGNWVVYHKNIGNTHELVLNETGGKAASQPSWNNTTPTDTVFTVGPDSNNTNKSGQTFIALLFADNSSEDAEDQMIKCGGYTGTGADLSINLGWEPQFVIVKNTSAARNWRMFDSMRGVATEGISPILTPNSADAEFNTSNFIRFNSLGFELDTSAGNDVNSNNDSHIYMAIRAPMMVKPEAATDVYASNIWAGNGANGRSFTGLGLTPDVNITVGRASAPHCLSARMLPVGMFTTHNTDAQYSSLSGWLQYDMDGFTMPTSYSYSNASGSNYIAHNFKRAKGFMDVVCDTRAFTYGTLNHSLGVVPELIIKKDRSRANNWDVLPNVSPYDYRYNIYLNNTQAISGPSSAYWNSAPTNTSFGVHYGNDGSSNGDNFVFYLFASLAGVSKVGSYTGNGSNQTINCGFSAGARFILIKRTDAAGDWYVWDSVRGIVAGNDPYKTLNSTAAEVTSNDSIDPANSGFIVNQVSATNINVSSGTYIFYAIA